MAGWPTIDRADDRRLAQALAAGDEAALARIYDAYAPRLFDYCHGLLRDQDMAALALHDSLITVRERIATLPDPRLFRGWMYAVTRRECLRRRAATEPSAERPPTADGAGVETAGIEVDETTRWLAHTALAVLTGRRREALDLALRHDLDPDELAEVLATTPQEASARVAQARHDLDDASAAVMVAATGRDDCPSVAALAGPPDRPLDAQTCGKLARHIASCPICGGPGGRRVAGAQLLRAIPVAVLPPGLRSLVLTTASAPHLEHIRSTIAMRAEQLPDPSDQAPESDRTPLLWPVLAALTCGILVIGGIFVLMPGSGEQKASGSQALDPAPGGSPPASVFPSERPSTPSPGRRSRTPSPTPATTSKAPSPTPGHASRRAMRTQPPAPQPPPPAPKPAHATLAVMGCHMEETSSTCRVTVTAQGGPVNWSVTGTSGEISAAGGGYLNPGQPAWVTVRRRGGWCLDSGGGSVSFTPAASADVSWSC